MTTTYAAPVTVPPPSRPARARDELPTTAAAPAAETATEVEREKTAFALALSAAGAVGLFVAGAVALLLIASLGPHAGEGDDVEPTAAVADAR